MACAPLSTAYRLGYLALLPFMLGAALVWLVRDSGQTLAASALNAYAAVVISFLGGIHWGLGLQQSQPPASLFLWGVVPSLVACGALLLPNAAALASHAAMLALCYLVDRKVYPLHGASAWLPLRFRLTAIAAFSCLAGAAGSTQMG